MKLAISHPWDLTIEEARALQRQLARQVVARTTFEPAEVRWVAGVAVSLQKDTARAAVVVLSYPHLKPVDYALGQAPLTFPYVPGLLTFREGPSVLKALEKLAVWPDLLIFDGHGVAHPRRAGLAAHMGVILDHPSVGCAKSRLVGSHEEPGDAAGDWAALHDGDEIIGAVVRSRTSRYTCRSATGLTYRQRSTLSWAARRATGFPKPPATRTG
jgi:deoxyribonuclease V